MRPPQVPVAEVRGSPRPVPPRTPSIAPPTLPTPPSEEETPLPAKPRQTPPPPPPSPATPPAPHVLCDVCCEHVSPRVLRGCASCTHRYCAPCVDKYWTGAIYSGNHARLLCMYGGCGVFATDHDIASVVSPRTFRKMLYFRSRDRYHACPDARWCARDMCWEFLGRHTIPAMSDPVLTCSRCDSRTCVKCERLVSTSESGSRGGRHVCAARKPNKAHTALFGLWATVHTKACPACAARIQRNHGCSHMTCTRCSSYFCWRCKGFLNNGCPLPGRACICDRVMTAAAYSGLAIATVIGSPVIITAVIIGGGPYVAYRIIKARRERARTRRSPPSSAATSTNGLPVGMGQHRVDMVGDGSNISVTSVPRSARPGRTPGRVLQPDEMVGQEDDDFDSGSTRLTAFSEVMVTEARALGARPARRLRVQLQAQQREAERAHGVGEGADRSESYENGENKMYEDLQQQVDRAMRVISREEDDLFGGSSGTLDSTGSSSESEGAGSVDGGAADVVPSVNIDTCKVARPFVLERRRGSVSGTRVVRRTIL